jgi:hypothetical protein
MMIHTHFCYECRHNWLHEDEGCDGQAIVEATCPECEGAPMHTGSDEVPDGEVDE